MGLETWLVSGTWRATRACSSIGPADLTASRQPCRKSKTEKQDREAPDATDATRSLHTFTGYGPPLDYNVVRGRWLPKHDKGRKRRRAEYNEAQSRPQSELQPRGSSHSTSSKTRASRSLHIQIQTKVYPSDAQTTMLYTTPSESSTPPTQPQITLRPHCAPLPNIHPKRREAISQRSYA